MFCSETEKNKWTIFKKKFAKVRCDFEDKGVIAEFIAKGTEYDIPVDHILENTSKISSIMKACDTNEPGIAKMVAAWQDLVFTVGFMDQEDFCGLEIPMTASDTPDLDIDIDAIRRCILPNCPEVLEEKCRALKAEVLSDKSLEELSKNVDELRKTLQTKRDELGTSQREKIDLEQYMIGFLNPAVREKIRQVYDDYSLILCEYFKCLEEHGIILDRTKILNQVGELLRNWIFGRIAEDELTRKLAEYLK